MPICVFPKKRNFLNETQCPNIPPLNLSKSHSRAVYTVDNQILSWVKKSETRPLPLLAFGDIFRRRGAGWLSDVKLVSDSSTINLQNTEAVCTTSWQRRASPNRRDRANVLALWLDVTVRSRPAFTQDYRSVSPALHPVQSHWYRTSPPVAEHSGELPWSHVIKGR